jgi:perosamine synthetase
MTNKPMNEFPLLNADEGIPLFYPHIPEGAIEEVADTLSGRWIGQGPKVDKFEQEFKEKFLGNHEAIAVGSGTDALHLSYLLSDIQAGDEVIVPVFTCTATNLPLLYIGATPVFADIDPETMNICCEDVRRKITSKTKAISCVDYGGVPCDYDELNKICKEYNLKLISDAAHAIGSKYKGTFSAQHADFTIFSFQAIKTLTTGDGGLLAIKDHNLIEKAKRLRWFGIDRTAKQGGHWENDIVEVGYKYQMNDISAAIGLAGMKDIDKIIEYRNYLFSLYEEYLDSSEVTLIGSTRDSEYFNSAWLATIYVSGNREALMNKLRENNIESAQVHYRNDRYTVFGGRIDGLPNMDKYEDLYICLPLHTKMSREHVEKICALVNEGW